MPKATQNTYGASGATAVRPEGLRFLMQARTMPDWRRIRAPLFLCVLALIVLLTNAAVSRMIELPAESDSVGAHKYARHLFLISSFKLALLIPVYLWLAHRMLGLSPGQVFWAGDGFRFRLFVWTLAIASLPIALAMGLSFYWLGNLGRFSPDWAVLVSSTFILMPLRCLSDNILYRSLLPQALTSWIGHGATGAIVAIITSAVAYGLTRGFTEPGMIFLTISVALVMSWLAWLTAGIESPTALNIIIHVTYLVCAACSVSFHTEVMKQQSLRSDHLFMIIVEIALTGVVFAIARRRNEI